MIPQIFTVLTEFKFEIGEAVLHTDTLSGAVDKLSQSADNAVNSLQYAAASIVGSFVSGTGGGILGVLYSAVTAADKFNSSQISLANTLSTPGESFAMAMERANEAMENIGNVAKKFSLPADDLLQMTKLLGPMLAVHGLAGNNYSRATDLGRKFLKSAPMLGVDPSMSIGQLQRTMGGQASMGDTLFQRLSGETKAMQPYMGNTKAFNSLDATERIKVLNRALDQFSSNTAAVTAQAHTLSGEMQRLKTNLYGTFSILKDIGDVLLKPIKQVLSGLNQYLEDHGKEISKNVGRMIEPWISDSKSFIATLMQVRDLKKHVSETGSILGTMGKILGLNALLSWLGIEIPIVSGALRMLVFSIDSLFKPVGMAMSEFAAFSGTLMGFISVLTNLVMLGGLLVFVFQLFSRALAYAKMEALENIAKMMPKITEAFANFSGLLGFFMSGFDQLARWLGKILDPTKFLGFIDLVSIAIGALNLITDVTALVVMGFQGLALALMEFVNQVYSFVTGGGFDKGRIAEAFNFGMEETYNKIYGKVKDPAQGGTSNQVVNMDVKMENHFKEMMEPDRVAFTIKDQLLKASQNRTSGSKASFKPAGAF